ncbi:hypothetical protein OUZ56_014570 [Daphnia magna]|uniref:Uncharacterized protein n=1 Tax=Daphnia magna TaxID=35525 RepID=A0ABR0AK64_9CRUS|nr:hypothetical protein OUZ56_014570 [Daphnia magna]
MKSFERDQDSSEYDPTLMQFDGTLTFSQVAVLFNGAALDATTDLGRCCQALFAPENTAIQKDFFSSHSAFD